MTKEQAEAEVKYCIARSIYSALFRHGAISEDELCIALKDAVGKYHPLSGELEVNSIVGKEDYTSRFS